VLSLVWVRSKIPTLYQKRDVGIEEEDLFGFPTEEEASDEEDDCEFEGGNNDDYEDGRE
jgi:hypothetical protein